MKITKRYMEDIIALLEHVKKVRAKQGDVWSDTKISQLAMGYGDFVPVIRKWNMGKRSPTIEKLMKLENFLRDQLTDEEYDSFVEERVTDATFDA